MQVGEDPERKRFWEYSAERAEMYDERQEKKAKQSDTKFTGGFTLLRL